ncbi:bifunctional diguanylate cyclase/phosphodiesterase [Arsukibacterium sp.]|uniref:bifunctional diguanylate cyclase/phosphodiesterase n=1 Tax=Arsukibacterium sp. TaxID=1977258 RepID=UPI002FDB59C6
MAVHRNEQLVFADEAAESSNPQEQEPWNILLVDDEPDVHTVTRLALKDLLFQQRPLAFVSAYSAAEAMTLLQQQPEFAVALIDVVMESDDAGLMLVRHIRENLHNNNIRLILRTGQPGYAPEIDSIRLYDINDYKTKPELTRVRLFTSITMAIRSYAQIKQLEANRNGLEHILAASTALGKPAGMKKFADGIVTQLCALLKVTEECLICAVLNSPDEQPKVLAASGRFSCWMGIPLTEVPDKRVRQHLTQVLKAQHHVFDNGVGVYFAGTDNQALAAFVDLPRALTELEQGLLQVFCSNIAVAFENLQLYTAIEQLAYIDPLVGLPNRNGFIAKIEQQSSQCALEPQAVALVDLDNFSYINSVLDDAFGDKILCAVAQRLQAQLANSTYIARVGGDLFGLLGAAADLTTERISAVFAEPFALQHNEPLRISATSGLIVLHQQPGSAVEILKNAGVALKQAKHFQRGKTLVFQTELAEAARDRMQLLSRLRTAFSIERLHLHYQPFVRLADNATVGAECLLRWKTDDGNYIPPDRFIPLAEQSGMMVALGDWVIRSALRWRAGLAGRVDDNFRVAINVSQVQFCEPQFVDNLIEQVNACGLQGHHVEIELTESVAADDLANVKHKLQHLRQHGIRIAMDDFGTGYSSLSILRSLPIDRLKIDRSFVSGEQADLATNGIAQTIIALASHMQLKTIAEGIETEQQLAALLQTGCQEGQGYLFSKPLDEQQFSAWLVQSAVRPG